MKNRILVLSTAALITGCLSMTAAATEPADWSHCNLEVQDMAAPVVVDGGSANIESMATTQLAVETYIAEVTEFLDGGCSFSASSHKRLMARAEHVAQEYNESLKSYRLNAGNEALAASK